jgi:hypothetical protein
MRFPKLKAPSWGVWSATLVLCAVFGLIYLAGVDPIPIMIGAAIVILIIGAVVRSRGFPSL